MAELRIKQVSSREKWYDRVFLVSEYQVLAKMHILLRKAEYYHKSCKRIPAAIALIRLRRLQNKYL